MCALWTWKANKVQSQVHGTRSTAVGIRSATAPDSLQWDVD